MKGIKFHARKVQEKKLKYRVDSFAAYNSFRICPQRPNATTIRACYKTEQKAWLSPINQLIFDFYKNFNFW